LTGLRPHQVSRAGIARTFQRVRLFGDLTVRENVEAGAVASGASRREARNLAVTLLAEIEGTAWADRFANELPYGHERLVEIARALATRPRFLVLDEPAAGMDEAESAQLLAKLAKLPQEKGLGMIIIDHDMRCVFRKPRQSSPPLPCWS
jgi:branched-chain amino acid transport system ATP-binding protein